MKLKRKEMDSHVSMIRTVRNALLFDDMDCHVILLIPSLCTSVCNMQFFYALEHLHLCSWQEAFEQQMLADEYLKVWILHSLCKFG